MDDLSPNSIRSQAFTQARRGYDRAEVDGFLQKVSQRVAGLTEELDGLKERLHQLGLDDPKDLKAEFDAIGSEVQDVLQAARQAAEEMRSRAAADAARWRSDADTESRAMREEAQYIANELRGTAWETGTTLLDDVRAAADDAMRGAEQDALFIRAEAERETLRLTADARRQAEEERRQAREEAERILMNARAESESILASARQSAEAAQERARALEERRSELMNELEAARESIGQMEAEIDSRREALYMAGVNEPSGMRVIAPDVAGTEWDDDDAGVRVVPVAQFEAAEPVDADAMADEVRQLRQVSAPSGVSAQEIVAETEIPPGEAAAFEPVSRVAPSGGVGLSEPPSSPLLPHELAGDSRAAGASEPSVVGVETEPSSTAQPTPAAPPPPPTPTGTVPGSAEDQPATTGPEAAAPQAPEIEISEPEAMPDVAEAVGNGPPTAKASDELSGLFASLRTPPSPAGEPAAEPAAAAEPEAAESEPPADEASPPPEPEPDTISTADLSLADAFEVRDRLLLPIQNRALRSVKRRLVDLQNRVLEEMRVDGAEWSPEEPMFRGALAEELRPVRQEAYVAGYAAAAELLGEAEAPPPSGPPPADDVPDVVSALVGAVAEALSKSRGSGAGHRETASSVSKVFRAWRTDEAERRVRWTARAAYHRGLAHGMAALGVTRVLAVAPGRPCGACAAGTGVSWDPAAGPPDGLVMPPASSECAASLVPAARPS